ncbi:hypothetical protein, partial [Cryobacterium sp. MLB-32]
MRTLSSIRKEHVAIGGLAIGGIVILILLFVYNLVVTRANPPVPGPGISSAQQFAAAWAGFTSTWVAPLQQSATS